MSSSEIFWLRFCSSSPRQMSKVLCRTEPGKDLGHVDFVQSCTSCVHALKSWDIAALSLCLCSSCFLVELSSTAQFLLLLQLCGHASLIIGMLVVLTAHKLLGLGTSIKSSLSSPNPPLIS